MHRPFWRCLAAAFAFATSFAFSAPAPLASPDLASLVFRNGPDVQPASAIQVIGFGPSGSIYVAGPFTSVDGQSRPHGVARLHVDGTLDSAWIPSLPYFDAPHLAVESATGAVAMVVLPAGPAFHHALVLVPAASSAGTVIADTPGIDAIAFDASDALYVAVALLPIPPGTLFPGNERRVDVRKYLAGGTLDAAFELHLSGDYNNCRVFTPPISAVTALLLQGSLLYVAGNFTDVTNAHASASIGGAVRVSAATGDVDTSWAPMSSGIPAPGASEAKFTCFLQPGGAVFTMLPAPGGALYLGGSFERQGRKYLGRFSTLPPGTVDAAWNPETMGAVSSLALDAAANHLYMAGNFTAAGGWSRNGIAAFSTAPGAALLAAWDPNAPGVSRMYLAADRLLIGGTFTVVGGQSRAHLAGLPLASVPPTGPLVDLTPRILDFGVVAQDVVANRDVAVHNTGDAPLVIQTVAVNNPTGAFSHAHDCGSPVAPGGTCTITVSWRATPNETSGTMTVTSNGSGTPQVVTLKATFAYPRIEFDGDGAFAPTPVDATRTKTVTIRSTGLAPFSFAGFTVAATAAGDFAQTNDCPASLPANASCTLSITFAPKAATQSYGAVLIAFNGVALVPEYAPNGGARLSLTGTGQARTGDADDDGIPNDVEIVEGRNPTVKDNDIFGSRRLFVMQQFRDFLGREGDPGGITFWTEQLSLGTLDRGSLIQSFFTSPEFQGTIAPVARLYFAYFLRVPDYGGINFWIGYYRAGNSLEAISNFFAGSGEFAARYGALGNADFVDRVYRNVLGRAPDAGGLAFWTRQLDTGALTRGQVMLGFSESPEYRGEVASEVYVTMMYIGMLRRAPDPSGFAFWTAYLDSGNSGLALINGFLGASEYRGRFLP